MSRHGTVRDARLPEGLSKRKLLHYKRDVAHLGLDTIIILSLASLAPMVYSSGSALLGGSFAVTVLLVSYHIAKRIRLLQSPTLHLHISNMPRLTSPRMEHIAGGMGVDAGSDVMLAAGEGPGTASISDEWVVMVELEPELEDGWYREGYVVAAETPSEVYEALTEELGDDFEKHQVTHLRKLETTTTSLAEKVNVTNTTRPWIDRRDDPMKVYTIMQLTEGLSFFTNAEHTGGPHIIGHSVAGAWRATENLYETRTFTEVVAHHELHELVHWACDHNGDVEIDESGWDAVMYDILDYIQEDEQPDGPWALHERKIHARLTRPYDSEADTAESALSGPFSERIAELESGSAD